MADALIVLDHRNAGFLRHELHEAFAAPRNDQVDQTIAELADAMKIKQNYLYRVLPALAKDGLVSKKGRGWHPKDAA